MLGDQTRARSFFAGVGEHFLIALAAFALTLPAPAFSITIDFEDYSDGTALTGEYPGVTFANATVVSAGLSLNEFEFPPHSGTNVALDDGQPMVLMFDGVVDSFEAYLTYVVPLTLTAYDASNSVLGSVASAFSNNTALSGDPGSSPAELLSLVAGGIRRVQISGDSAGGSLTVDDISYTTSAVPEPSTAWLVLAGVALGWGWTRRRCTGVS